MIDLRNPIVVAVLAMTIVLWTAGGLFFRINRNLERQRRVYRVFIPLAAVMFVGLTLAVGLPPSTLIVTIPIAALFVILNLRWARFCSNCALMIRGTPLFGYRKSCPRCGTELDE